MIPVANIYSTDEVSWSSMMIPFSLEQFLGVFGTYNTSVWPVQVFLNALGIAALLVTWKGIKNTSAIVFSILAFLWFWMGIVYHLIFFTEINKAAYIFSILFIAQGIIFLYQGLRSKKLAFQFTFKRNGLIGLVLIIYALVAYPVFGVLLGHVYPESPTFGLPCPTVIFTFGMLFYIKDRLPFFIYLIPLFWVLIGTFAALNLGMKEDLGLTAAALIWFFSKQLKSREITTTHLRP